MEAQTVTLEVDQGTRCSKTSSDIIINSNSSNNTQDTQQDFIISKIKESLHTWYTKDLECLVHPLVNSTPSPSSPQQVAILQFSNSSLSQHQQTPSISPSNLPSLSNLLPPLTSTSPQYYFLNSSLPLNLPLITTLQTSLQPLVL